MASRRKHRVDISILPPFRPQVSRSALRKLALRALNQMLPGEAYQVDLAISDDDTIRRLNREYRGLDEATDVLSFSQRYQGNWEGEGEPPNVAEIDMPSELPEGELAHLGEVIISYPQVLRQAGPGPTGYQAELDLLVAHGILHLLGYDHVEPQEQARMRAEEQKILSLTSA